MTTVYLIRHSVRIPLKCINEYNSSQDDVVRNEKICLSVLGEKRAEILSKKDELQNMDVVYVSNCVRTIQTAKYLVENQNLNFNIDERFDERRVGKKIDDGVVDRSLLQYHDENYKSFGSESQLDVRARFDEGMRSILNKYKGKRVAVFTHGHAMSFYLMKFCEFIDAKRLENGIKLTLKFNGEVVIDRSINAPEVAKLIFDDNNELVSVKFIVFDDLEYLYGV